MSITSEIRELIRCHPPRSALVLLASFIIGTHLSAGESALERYLNRDLQFQDGTVTVGENLATIELPEGMRYLGPQDAHHVVHVFWGNPMSGIKILGMVVPESMVAEQTSIQAPPEQDAEALPNDPGWSPADDVTNATGSWGMIITWMPGFVDDRRDNPIDWDDLLSQMQEAAEKENQQRRIRGYQVADLVGWAEPPHHDPERHILYWAKSLVFSYDKRTTLPRSIPRKVLDSMRSEQINYCIRMLGARGVLEFNTVADLTALADVGPLSAEVIQRVEFTTGNEFSAHRRGVDPVYRGKVESLITGPTGGTVDADPGNLDLAVHTRSSLWWIVFLVLATLVLLVIKNVARGRPLLSLGTPSKPMSSRFAHPPTRGGANVESGTCPKCSQRVAHGVARCPACGGSLVTPR